MGIGVQKKKQQTPNGNKQVTTVIYYQGIELDKGTIQGNLLFVYKLILGV